MLHLSPQMISFDVLSLPLWHQFPRRVFWNLSNGFGPWDTEQSNDKNVMLVEDKIHWVELDQKKHRIMWQTVFPVMKSVAPSELLRLDRKDSVGPKITNWWNRVHRRENTCHLSSLRLVRSHKDFQGIYWKMCKELGCRKKMQSEQKEI